MSIEHRLYSHQSCKEQSMTRAHGDQCSHAAVDRARKLSLATVVSTVLVTLEQHDGQHGVQ